MQENTNICNGTCELKIIELQLNKILRDKFAPVNLTLKVVILNLLKYLLTNRSILEQSSSNTNHFSLFTNH